MTSAEIAALGWVMVGALAGMIVFLVILVSVVQHLRRGRRLRCEQRIRALAIAVMMSDQAAQVSELRALILRYPHSAFAVLTRLLWLVRGAWVERLRNALDDPEIVRRCRRWVRHSQPEMRGWSAEILGQAAHPEDLPVLNDLMRQVRPVAGSAAIGVLRGWPVTHPSACAVLLRLEEIRPDLLRALLPHLDRQALQEQLLVWVKDPVSLPLAVFIAGRLALDVPVATLLAAMNHPRVQVRRAACIAVCAAEHDACRNRLAELADDVEVLVRVAAVRALGRIPHPDNLPVLRRILDAGPWLVQSHAVPAILAHGENGQLLLNQKRSDGWRSGAVRWIRELAAPEGASP